MTSKRLMRHATALALGLAALALAATPSFAQTYELCASDGTVTIGAESIPIWGYADVSDGSPCTTGLATLPGPELRATAGGTLIINLHNALSVPVSFFSPGLRADVPNDGTGLFTSEAANGGLVMYTFTNIKAGTYLYHSGTDITTQVPMGLYGALVVDVAPGQAYDDVTYAQDEVLLYSEIDPDLNDGTYTGGARVINWVPQYFLINGAAFDPANPPIAINTSQDTLLRFVNAGLQTFVPTLDGGLYMDLVAEDGNRYPQPFKQYGIELPAGKTIEAIVSPGTDGTYALYDRAGHLTNGGLLTYLQAGAAAGAPTAVDDPATPGAYTIDEDAVAGLVVAAPGVLANDTGTGLTAALITSTANGVLTLNPDGSFTYTPNADFNGTDTFEYLANDGTLDSNVATVTITVTPVDDQPVAKDDSATTPPSVAVIIDVVANDTDPDGNLDPTTVNNICATCTSPLGSLTNNGDGTFTYSNAAAGIDTFIYEVCDTTALCDTATVTIDVVNSPPVANADSATTPLNTAVAVNVAANDTDPDGNLDPTTVTVSTPATNGAAVSNGDGIVTYTPNTNFAGEDSFGYQVCDTGSPALCATATVTITVENATPFAADDFAAVARNSGAADPANTFSVTANDVDSDDGIAVATVDLNPALAGRQTSVTTARGGTATVDALGNVTFTPRRGFRGTDTFTYTVQDTLGATSNVATVRVNVR